MKIRFDTLNKKPKLYDVLIVGAPVLAAVIALSVIGNGSYVLPIALILDVFFAYRQDFFAFFQTIPIEDDIE